MRCWIAAIGAALFANLGLAGETRVGPWTFVSGANGFGHLSYADQVVVEKVVIAGFEPGWRGDRFHFTGAAPEMRADGRAIVWTRTMPGQARLTLTLTLSETAAAWTLEGTLEPEGPCEYGLYLPTRTYSHTEDGIQARADTAVTDLGARKFPPIGIKNSIAFERPGFTFNWTCSSAPGRFMLQDMRARTPSNLRLITVFPVDRNAVRVKASARLAVTAYGRAESARRQAVLFQKTHWSAAIPLANSGFEDKGGGWRLPANAAVCADSPHTGKRCVRLVVNDPMKNSVYITRQVPVVGGSAYAVDCYVKTRSVAAAMGKMASVGAGLIVEWADKKGKWLAAGEYACKLFGDHDWTHRKCEDLRAPDNAGYAIVFLALRGTGTAWFDDLSMTRVFKTFALERPPPDGRLHDNTPAFAWRGDAKASQYKLELSRDRTFPPVATRTYTTKEDRFTLTDPIPPGKWLWRVSAPGYENSVVWRFEQTAPLDADTTAPVLLDEAVRLTSADEKATISVADENGAVPRIQAALAGKNLDSAVTPEGNNRFQVKLTCPGGWRRGLNTVRFSAVDKAGNKNDKTLWIVFHPVPENAVRIERDGAYSSGGKRVFPFGIYQVSPAAMPTVKAAGFDVVHVYTWESNQDDRAAREYLDAAWRNGLRVFIGFDRGNSSKNGIVQGNVQHLVNRVAALADHPGLFCWYLFDEPEVAHQYISPTMLIRYADLIRALDPYHPVVVTTWGKGMNRYRRSWDTHWTQAYRRPDGVVRQLRDHDRLLLHKSPITLLVHCYDRTQSELLKSGKSIDKSKFEPDPAWMRAAAFAGLTQNINGLWWWWYADTVARSLTVADVPHAWRALSRLVHDLQRLEPVLAAPGRGTAATLQIKGQDVEVWSKTVRGVTTVIAVNTGEKPVRVDVPVQAGAGPVDVLFEGRRTARANGRIRDAFKRYGVHVYRFGGAR